jgi:hypothetical protein
MAVFTFIMHVGHTHHAHRTYSSCKSDIHIMHIGHTHHAGRTYSLCMSDMHDGYERT